MSSKWHNLVFSVLKNDNQGQKLMSIEGSNMIFHSLTFARSRGNGVENRGRSTRFSTFPRDLANVNE